jgi:hypothetical protein
LAESLPLLAHADVCDDLTLEWRPNDGSQPMPTGAVRPPVCLSPVGRITFHVAHAWTLPLFPRTTFVYRPLRRSAHTEERNRNRKPGMARARASRHGESESKPAWREREQAGLRSPTAPRHDQTCRAVAAASAPARRSRRPSTSAPAGRIRRHKTRSASPTQRVRVLRLRGAGCSRGSPRLEQEQSPCRRLQPL